MILIDKTKILETVTVDKPFVCCFLHDDNSYMCFVHQVEPVKKLFQFVIPVPKETSVQNRDIEEYNRYWYALYTICRSKNPNSKESRTIANNLIPVEWKLVDSAQFVNEDFNSCIREFLLKIFKGSTCEIVSFHKELSDIDGSLEVID